MESEILGGLSGCGGADEFKLRLARLVEMDARRLWREEFLAHLATAHPLFDPVDFADRLVHALLYGENGGFGYL